ncbi:MAG: ABC transporter ATP-binding protein, partial [Chloroflexota bacterium]|nr:ABC transporter ATP-binding protein [Chloroflexota bacterium]
MGFFAGLNDEKYDRQYTDRELMRRIFAYFKPQTGRLVWVIVLVVILAAIGAALPVVVARMVDSLRDQPSVQAIGIIGLTVLLIGVG